MTLKLAPTKKNKSDQNLPDLKAQEIRRLKRRVKKLNRKFEITQAQLNHQRQVLDAVTNSLSWKLTIPLRDGKKLAKKLWPLLRLKKHKLTFRPELNVEVVGTKFKASSSSARVSLESTRGFLPTNFILFETTLKDPQESQLLRLYFGAHEKLNRIDGVVLLGLKPGFNRVRLRLPRKVSRLYLEPLLINEWLELEKTSIREIGSAQVIFDKIWQRLKPFAKNPRMIKGFVLKSLSIYKEGGMRALLSKFSTLNNTQQYTEWTQKYDTLTSEDHTRIKARIESLTYQPKISVVMPTYNSDEVLLTEAIESVRKQLYTNWELCIADDNSAAPQVKKVLTKYQALDNRIKVVYRATNGHIAEASNSALEIATGEFVSLLDHDDLLREHALYMVVEELNRHKNADLIYSDEDKITEEGFRCGAYFKPDFNHELLLAQNYICHLSTFRTALLKKIGGFAKGVDGSQDWDLILRVVEQTKPENIRHIPHILYHWRQVVGSTAQSTAYKPYVLEAQKKTVSRHLERIGQPAKIKILKDISHVRAIFPIPSPEPKVSMIIPTKDAVHLVKQAIDSIIERTSYQNYEIIILDNGSNKAATLKYFDLIQKKYSNIKVVRDDGPFSYSRINNHAFKFCTGDYIALINNDIEVVSRDWLREMVSHASRPGVGAVGARLYWPNNLLQHGGVILGIGGVAGHAHKGALKTNPGYWNAIVLTHELSSVTAACMLVPRKVYEQLGGLDEVNLPVSFNDVDFCLRIREAGLKVIYAPYAKLYHHESASRGYEDTPEKVARAEKEIGYMHKRWGHILRNDPYYNPNLTLLTEDYQLAFPPRAEKPWR